MEPGFDSGLDSITWAMTPALFCFSYFSSKFFHLCLGLPSDHDPPTYALLHSWDYRHALSYSVYWVRWWWWWWRFLTLFLGWPWTRILLISVSDIAGITSVSHHATGGDLNPDGAQSLDLLHCISEEQLSTRVTKRPKPSHRQLPAAEPRGANRTWLLGEPRMVDCGQLQLGRDGGIRRGPPKLPLPWGLCWTQHVCEGCLASAGTGQTLSARMGRKSLPASLRI
jgi:hypothetical protein